MEENKTVDLVPKQKNWLNRHPVLSLIGMLIVFVIVLAILGSSQPQSQSAPTAQATVPPVVTVCSSFQTSQAKKINFATLNKNPDSFNGTNAEFTGQIIQIQESNGQGVIRLAVTKDSYGWSGSDIIFVAYTGHNDFVENDVVNVYGVLKGSYTYTSQANFQITLPSMIACSIEKPTVIQKTSKVSVPTNNTTVNTTPATPIVPKSWHTVTTYSNNVNTQTPPFSMQGSQWRVTYSCTITDPTYGSNGVNFFNGTIDDITSNSSAMQFANTVTCPTNNTSYAYSQSPGQYYLDLQLDNANYAVKVEDYY